ncbi:MAG: hypothetical protein NZ700_08840 [Gemmataceae bacterium]|nr:hypothetical protein [Gemmataceae bacterium]MDW8266283.1 hypothetical protein [Gemmataceae bacterium]
MLTDPSQPTTDTTVPRAKRPYVPPEKTIWQRYSAHHELPMSAAGSLLVHGLGLGLLVVLAVLGIRLARNTDPLPLEPIAIGGGGGLPGLTGDGPGTGEAPRENVQERPTPSNETPSVPRFEDLPPAKVDPIDFPEFKNDPDAMRMIEESRVAAAALAKVSKEARRQLMEGLAGSGGRGGGGRDGGKDSGTDRGTGSGTGPGHGNLDVRTRRVIRWVMNFDTRDGNDYARQLQALGAILGIPEPDGQYRIIRDLTQRPATGEIEDLRKIQRMYWVDDVPESVRSLAQALQLPQVPNHIVAFFPEQFEADLLRKELAFRGLKEHQIRETRFRIVRKGTGYEAVVVDQR